MATASRHRVKGLQSKAVEKGTLRMFFEERKAENALIKI